MKKVTNYLNSLNYNKFFLLLIITGYFPLFIFGYFIQDDLWKPVYSLRDGLKKTIEWYILNKKGIKRK